MHAPALPLVTLSPFKINWESCGNWFSFTNDIVERLGFERREDKDGLTRNGISNWHFVCVVIKLTCSPPSDRERPEIDLASLENDLCLSKTIGHIDVGGRMLDRRSPKLHSGFTWLAQQLCNCRDTTKINYISKTTIEKCVTNVVTAIQDDGDVTIIVTSQKCADIT